MPAMAGLSAFRLAGLSLLRFRAVIRPEAGFSILSKAARKRDGRRSVVSYNRSVVRSLGRSVGRSVGQPDGFEFPFRAGIGGEKKKKKKKKQQKKRGEEKGLWHAARGNRGILLRAAGNSAQPPPTGTSDESIDLGVGLKTPLSPRPAPLAAALATAPPPPCSSSALSSPRALRLPVPPSLRLSPRHRAHRAALPASSFFSPESGPN